MEFARVARPTRKGEAPLLAAHAGRSATFQALVDLMFPGYGFGAMNLGEPVALFAVEIPKMNEQRYLSFVQNGDSWVLREDFDWPDAKGFINAALITDDRIQYLTHCGEVVREGGR